MTRSDQKTRGQAAAGVSKPPEGDGGSLPPAPSGARGWGKLGMLALVVVAAGLGWWWFGAYLSLEALATHESALRRFASEQPLLAYVLAFGCYVLVTALSLPAAAAISLLYGWLFGFWPALALVSFASTLGATLAFLLSRHLFREAIERRFGQRARAFQQALDREGAFYLFSLRLIPAVPFFVINVAMGLTRMRVFTFWWVSQVGMLAGTAVYIYAGASVPSLEEIRDPARLRAAQVADWPGFAQALVDAARQEADPAAGGSPPRVAFARRVAAPARALLAPGVSPDEAARAQGAIVSAVNAALDEPGAFGPAEAGLSGQRLRTRNRAAFEAAFPGLVAPPAPIIGWRLLAAFCLLGLFPLAVKKLFAWTRRRWSAATVEGEPAALASPRAHADPPPGA